MKTSLIALALLLLSACGTLPEIHFEESYGFCGEYCETTVSVSRHGLVSMAKLDKSKPALRATLQLNEDQQEELAAAVAQALSEKWESRYGCPDCADQGEWSLRIRVSGSVRETVLDPGDHPEHFDPLVDKLRNFWMSEFLPRE